MDHLDRLAKLLNEDPELIQERAVTRRQAAMEGPPEPKESLLAKLTQMPTRLTGVIEAGKCPPWLRDICRYRGAFDGTVLCFEPAGLGTATTYLSFMYACQSPQYIMFLALKKVKVVRPAGGSSYSEMQQWVKENWEHTFEKTEVYVSDQELPWEIPHGLRVLPQCCFRGNRVLSEDSPVPWAKWVDLNTEGQALPVKEQNEEGEEEQEDDPEQTLDKAFPWLKDIDGLSFDIFSATASGSDLTTKKKVAKEVGPDFASLTEAETLAIFRRLEAKRAEWAQSLPPQAEDF
eukprot:8484855-Lingulodinium_polyedra.AAC.1